MDYIGRYEKTIPALGLLPAVGAIGLGALLVVQGRILVELTHGQLATATEMPMSIPYLSLPVAGALMVLFGIEALFSKKPPAGHHAEVAE
jgi:TRAP-type C4-dicarboxylate transport system permease small subunit